MLKLNPANVTARRLLAERLGLENQPDSQEPPAPPPVNPATELIQETDVCLRYGLFDDALEHLQQLFAIDPENLDGHERVYKIYLEARNVERAHERLLTILRLCARRGEVERAQFYLNTLRRQFPHHPELPGFMAALRPEE